MQPTFVPFAEWAGAPRPLPLETALAELAARFLAAYGPARPEDMAHWSGLRMSDVREAWATIEDRLEQVETSNHPMWLLKSDLAAAEAITDSAPIVRLLPRFDNWLLAYASRNLVVPPVLDKYVRPGGGIIAATLTVDGRVLGTWAARPLRAAQPTTEVVIRPFHPLAENLVPLLELEVAGLGRFLGVNAVLRVAAAANQG